ncbi:KH domain-containing protein [Aminiphilus sp.]|uniref:KH domain-containing protein n=1 Tax=Aminiphilus sp. TaxID=1872488 RepID=UPI0026048EE7|nr:KH domain-containing protein [Aminiphilus sp.]
MPDYRELVDHIVRQLVTDPETVRVASEGKDDGSFLVRISVAQEDVGRIIGKKGATINAVRQVVRAAASKAGERVDVDVEES